MKKSITIALFICCLTLLPVFSAQAAESVNSATLSAQWFPDGSPTGEKNNASVDAELSSLLDNYFSFRENSLLGSTSLDSSLKTSVAEQVFSDELTRRQLIRDYQQRLNFAITAAEVTTTIKSVTTENNSQLVTVYEWTFYDYDYTNDNVAATDVSGFGTTHNLLIGQSDGQYFILEDRYTEEDLFGLVSASYKDTSAQQVNQSPAAGLSEDTAAPLALQAAAPETSVSAAAAIDYYELYDLEALIEYADTYAFNYNEQYTNFNDVGGDCANFVSQCIAAGGMPQAEGWYYNSTGYTTSWVGATSLYNWLAANRGKAVASAAAADIYVGSPIFYDFDASGDWDHATICVGTDSSGVPIMNAHNNDRFHVPWNYGDDGACVYGTVQLTTTPWFITVSNFSAAGQNSRIRLTWDALTGADGYYIYAMYEDGSLYKTYTTTAAACNFNNLVNGDSYSFKIRPYKAGTDGYRIYGNYSSVISAVAQTDGAANLQALTFNKKVRINWDAISGAQGYLIYVTYADGTLYKTYETSKTYCNFTNLLNDQAYNFKVCAYYYNSAGSKCYGKYCSELAATPFDDSVQNLTAAASDQKIRISWDAVSGAAGYYIYATYGSGDFYKTYTTSKTACNFTKLQNGQPYSFKVRAYKVDASGNQFNCAYSGLVTATPQLDCVSNLAALAFNQKIRINWDSLSGAEKYQIIVTYSDGSAYKTYTTANTYCNFTKLQNGTEYCFTVCGCTTLDNNIITGPFCTQVTATPYDDTVQNLSATPSDSKIKLSWDAVDGADGYYIYAMFADGSKYKTYATTKVTCNFTNLSNGQKYSFKVRAYKLDSTGARVYSTYSSPAAAVPNAA